MGQVFEEFVVIFHSLTIIISIWNMSSLVTFDFLELCPHLKSQWRHMSSQQGFIYQHTFSTDQSEVKYLTSLTIKELDLYSSRQAYSYHHCPRVYKYVIQKNHHRANELLFDLIVLVERVPYRLSNFKMTSTNSHQLKMLANKVVDIIKGFHYLYNRFGSFSITEEMIGWTELGVVKVWFNSDYSLNRKGNTATLEAMVEELVAILQKKSLLKQTVRKSNTFQSLLSNFEFPHQRKQSQNMKKQVTIKSFKKLNTSACHVKPLMSRNSRDTVLDDCRSKSKSRKNITFCFSNKEITVKSTINSRSGACFKRNSIQADFIEEFYLPASYGVSAQRSEIRKETSPTNSFKLNAPQERRGNNKKSFFGYEKREKEDAENIVPKPRNLQEHFSKTTQSSLNRKITGQFVPVKRTTNKDQPDYLHYSTSSNPCKKFFHPKRTQGKAYSTKGDPYLETGENECQKSISSKNESNLSELSSGAIEANSIQTRKEDEKKIRNEGIEEIGTFKIEEESNIRESQDVQKDLDALFHSDNSFDYNQLQNELDCIL